MVNSNSSLHDWSSTNRNSLTSTDVQSSNSNNTTTIILSVCAVILLAVILIIIRLFNRFCTKNNRKNRQHISYSRRFTSIFPIHNGLTSDRRRVSSVYIIPVRSYTISDSRGVSPIYPVPIRSNTISITTEDLPPSYQTVIQSNDLQYERFNQKDCL